MLVKQCKVTLRDGLNPFHGLWGCSAPPKSSPWGFLPNESHARWSGLRSCAPLPLRASVMQESNQGTPRQAMVGCLRIIVLILLSPMIQLSPFLWRCGDNFGFGWPECHDGRGEVRAQLRPCARVSRSFRPLVSTEDSVHQNTPTLTTYSHAPVFSWRGGMRGWRLGDCGRSVDPTFIALL